MKTPMKTADWAVISIFGTLSALLFFRGISALVTGTYKGTARLSGPFELHGMEAYLTGIAYVFLGALVSCAIGYQWGLHKKKVTIAASAFGIIAGLFFSLSLLAK